MACNATLVTGSGVTVWFVSFCFVVGFKGVFRIDFEIMLKCCVFEQ